MVDVQVRRQLEAAKEQVKAAKLTRDYDTEYGAEAADVFVEAVYKSLGGKK